MTALASPGVAPVSNRIATWWNSGLPPELKFVYFVLLANGVPAFCILLSIPDRTESWFVWTVEPPASARLLAVMYGNALMLVIFGFVQGSWHGARITLVVVSFFSVAATTGTFFSLDIFLEHPWYHLAYWLSMYLILFATAPMLLVVLSLRYRGTTPASTQPLSPFGRWTAILMILVLGTLGLMLLFKSDFLYQRWPWPFETIDGGMIGVWFIGLALAYGWALWDGDWLRVRPIFWQAVPTGASFAFIPLVHRDELVDGSAGRLAVYLGLAIGLALLHGAVILAHSGRASGASGLRALAGARPGLDVFALLLAGFVNTILSPIDAQLVLNDGLKTEVRELETRIAWVAGNARQWQIGWSFWFVVTLSFAWSYHAIARNLGGPKQWRDVAVGLALVAATIDITGLMINITALPHLARVFSEGATGDAESTLALYSTLEALAADAIYIVAFGLYSVAGLALLPGAFATPAFPRALAWLGAGLWVVACLATALLAIDEELAVGPLFLSFLLFAPWTWGCAIWLSSRSAPSPAPAVGG